MKGRRVVHILNAGLGVGLITAVAITAVTGEAPLGGWVGDPSRGVTQKPVNAPVWNAHLAKRFIGYSDADLAPGTRSWPESTVVVDLDGRAMKMGPDEVWKRAHNSRSGDDVWVVGIRH